jgi:hypothetical protein
MNQLKFIRNLKISVEKSKIRKRREGILESFKNIKIMKGPKSFAKKYFRKVKKSYLRKAKK